MWKMPRDVCVSVCVCVYIYCKNNFFHNRIDYIFFSFILHHCPMTQCQNLLDDIGLIELWYVARFPIHITFITAAAKLSPWDRWAPYFFFNSNQNCDKIKIIIGLGKLNEAFNILRIILFYRSTFIWSNFYSLVLIVHYIININLNLRYKSYYIL